MQPFEDRDHMRLALPEGEALETLVLELLPGRTGSRLPLEERRQALRRILKLAGAETRLVDSLRSSRDEATRRADQAEGKADERVRRAEDQRDHILRRFTGLQRDDRTLMMLVAQLTLAAGLVPAGLELVHEDEKPAKAEYKLGDQSVMLVGRDVDINRGGHRCTATGAGMTLPQGEAVAAYFRTVQELGSSDPAELARQLTAIVKGGMLEGIMAATGCGACDACIKLREALSEPGDMQQVIAALYEKSRTRCPASSKRDAVRVSVGVRPA